MVGWRKGNRERGKRGERKEREKEGVRKERFKHVCLCRLPLLVIFQSV